MGRFRGTVSPAANADPAGAAVVDPAAGDPIVAAPFVKPDGMDSHAPQLAVLDPAVLCVRKLHRRIGFADRLPVGGKAVWIILIGPRHTAVIAPGIKELQVPQGDPLQRLLRRAFQDEELFRHRCKEPEVLRRLSLSRDVVDPLFLPVQIPLAGIPKGFRHVLQIIRQPAVGNTGGQAVAGRIFEPDLPRFRVIGFNGSVLIHPEMPVADQAVPEVPEGSNLL